MTTTLALGAASVHDLFATSYQAAVQSAPDAPDSGDPDSGDIMIVLALAAALGTLMWPSR